MKTKSTARGTKSYLPPSRAHQIKPVIKINLNGILVYANEPGIAFLKTLGQHTQSPAISFLLRSFPVMLDPFCNADLNIVLGDRKYFFSAIAFREAGYVGLYFSLVAPVENPN